MGQDPGGAGGSSRHMTQYALREKTPHRRTLLDEVLEGMDEKARTGTPDMNWTCGKCGLTGKHGVKVFYTRRIVGVRRGREIIDFDHTLVCPNCSFARTNT